MTKPNQPQRDRVLIANGQAFWGDSILGPVRLVNEGPLDYLTLDYLAEVTMSIMQKLKSRDPNKGYATDFVDMCRRVLPECRKKGIKIIANAGGVNPAACRDAVRHVIEELGLSGIRIGIVEGDDIFDSLKSLIDAGESLTNMDNGEPLKSYLSQVKTANVYIGAEPIVEALQQGGRYCDHGPRNRSVDCTGPPDLRIRLVAERLGPAGRRDGRRTYHRMRNPVYRWQSRSLAQCPLTWPAWAILSSKPTLTVRS